jgi:hypothetical protein
VSPAGFLETKKENIMTTLEKLQKHKRELQEFRDTCPVCWKPIADRMIDLDDKLIDVERLLEKNEKRKEGQP